MCRDFGNVDNILINQLREDNMKLRKALLECQMAIRAADTKTMIDTIDKIVENGLKGTSR